MSFASLLNRPQSSLRIWAFGCAHCKADDDNGRKSLGVALQHANTFDWDVGIGLGDFSSASQQPASGDGEEVVSQFADLARPREHIYTLAGNHDADIPSTGGHGLTWYEKYIDPFGDFTSDSGVDDSHRPFPIASGGTLERYKFEIGNVIFLMMVDVNWEGAPYGKENAGGGYPAGKVSDSTLSWWESEVEAAASDQIVISCHHHALKETTIASGEYEGFVPDSGPSWEGKFHGYFSDGGPMGASYLYFNGTTADAQGFESYLNSNNGATDLWLCGHTHAKPEESVGSKTHIETKWGVHCINCSALTYYHNGPNNQNYPMSKLITLNGSTATIQTFMHSNHLHPAGFHKQVVTKSLATPFHR